MSRSAYTHYRCDCGVELTTAGFAVTAHERGKAHIAWLRTRLGQNAKREADRLEAEADAIKSNNNRRRAAGTYGYKRP